MKVKDLCRKYGMSDATYYKWKSKYGGMEASDLKRIREFEGENAKLKRMHPSSSGYWSTLAAMASRPIRHIQAGHRLRATCWSDSSAITVITRAAMRDGRVLAGHRLRRHFPEKGENSHAPIRRRRAG